jgi:hypothetical protein
MGEDHSGSKKNNADDYFEKGTFLFSVHKKNLHQYKSIKVFLRRFFLKKSGRRVWDEKSQMIAEQS